MNIVGINLQFPLLITQTICVRYICVLQRSLILFLAQFLINAIHIVVKHEQTQITNH